jgi:hypothetical protein
MDAVRCVLTAPLGSAAVTLALHQTIIFAVIHHAENIGLSNAQSGESDTGRRGKPSARRHPLHHYAKK